jgi:tetratricopeptide (TPR) repeat protein
MRRLFVPLLLLVSGSMVAAEPHLTSDYEIETARRQLERAQTSREKIAPNLNLGDIYGARHETEASERHYRAALRIAEEMAHSARKRSDLSSYADAVTYRAAALAKLGLAGDARAAFEEAIRYRSDDPSTWNLYASGMRVAGLPAKAEAAARNAVLLAVERRDRKAGTKATLDIAIYRYALAGAIYEQRREDPEVGELLAEVVETLDGPGLAKVRERARAQEIFEVFTIVRSEEDALVSLLNRALLLLGRHYEARGETGAARSAWERVLRMREDDSVALAGLARLATTPRETSQRHLSSLEANPWSIPQLRQYEAFAKSPDAPQPNGSSPGAAIQRAVWLLARDRGAEASLEIDRIENAHGERPATIYLKARAAIAMGNVDEAESLVGRLGNLPEAALLRRTMSTRDESLAASAEVLTSLDSPVVDPTSDLLIGLARLVSESRSPVELTRIDALLFQGTVDLDEALARDGITTVFASGTIDGTPFRFSVPVAFRGDLSDGEHRLEFRLAGIAGHTLLLEPVGLTP